MEIVGQKLIPNGSEVRSLSFVIPCIAYSSFPTQGPSVQIRAVSKCLLCRLPTLTVRVKLVEDRGVVAKLNRTRPEVGKVCPRPRILN